MNAFERVEQAAEVAAIKSNLAAMRSAAMVVNAKTAELVAIRNAWIAQVTAGVYGQADVDALNTLQTPVAALNAASTAFIAAVDGA
jgi:hypothetical protein